MRALICGLGSIGQRHVRILRQLYGSAVEIVALRQRSLDIVINDDMTAQNGIDPIAHYGIESCNDIDLALSSRPELVFVTNPISMHVPTALKAARAGANLFLEKPVSHDLTDVDALEAEVRSRQLTTMVGYQLRFHPMLAQVKAWLDSGEIGQPISAQLHFGEWLPGMHPYEDYRSSHAARRDQGGGVILCLSHEVDIAVWLFGSPRRVAAAGGHLSSLEMDHVEDAADLLLTCDWHGRALPVNVHLDFLQRPMRREGMVVGEKGTISWDFPTCTARLVPHPPGETKVWSDTTFRRNDMFLAEVKDFVEAAAAHRPSSIPLSEGLRTLRVCLAARREIDMGDGD